ncbi:MAG: TfoX/Sxy family protein [Rhodocyclaceae bacterium]|jgi:TfoX/Sxy family transcriptional regulator of competence genes|nr:TfoX/Sxy family protein [Rhodocyclaceae bacterium]
MAYDEGLAERLRDSMPAHSGITEKKMFGGLCFLSRGLMFAGIVGDALMARIGPQAYADALRRPHVREMDFTGKPMKGYVFIDPPGFEEDRDLARWVDACLQFVKTLPAKKPKVR